MAGGLLVGLSHKDAARFAFLLATPIIGAAAILKLPELAGAQGDGIRGQALVASLAAGVAAWFSVRFLMKYFETRTLIPFAVWSVGFGLGCTVYFLVCRWSPSAAGGTAAGPSAPCRPSDRWGNR